MKLETFVAGFFAIIIGGITGGTAAITWHIYHSTEPAKVVVEKNIDLVREAQKECMSRNPAHSFSLVQQDDGYAISCTPLKSTQEKQYEKSQVATLEKSQDWPVGQSEL